MKKWLRCVVLLQLLILFLAPALLAGGTRVLLIPKGGPASFWRIVEQGALEAGRELGVDVVVRGPFAEDRREDQVRIIEYGIDEQFDAIVLAPNHESVAAPILEKAAKSGVGVVLIDSDMASGFHSTLIQSDNSAAGRMAADYLAELIGTKGEVVLARHITGHASTYQREDAFMQTLASEYPDIVVVAAPYLGKSRGEAYHAISELLVQNPDIDGIFAVGEEVTLGILRAFMDYGKPQRLRFVGFDYNPQVEKAIHSGLVDGTLVQNPYRMGYEGVETALRITQGEAVPKNIYTAISLVTKRNFSSPEIKELLEWYRRAEKRASGQHP